MEANLLEFSARGAGSTSAVTGLRAGAARAGASLGPRSHGREDAIADGRGWLRPLQGAKPALELRLFALAVDRLRPVR
jgi:hypothetical protein